MVGGGCSVHRIMVEALASLIADPDMRTRDERVVDRAHHTSAPDLLPDKSGTAKKSWPVFANVRYNKRLDRFTLRGRAKVSGQWLPFCRVYNSEKRTHAEYAA